MLIVAMEEIAWGQYIFYFKVPPWFRDINLQNELTFHNIEGVQGNSGLPIRLFGWMGLIGIGFSFSKNFRKIGAPSILLLWFLMIIAMGYISSFIRSLMLLDSDDVLFDVFAETMELYIGLVGFLYIWLKTREFSFGRLRKAYAHNVSFDQEMLSVELKDGRNLSVPVKWFHPLLLADEIDRGRWELLSDGLAIHWPALDFKIRIESLFTGVISSENW
jgi:hypothetical protein